jgi:hypothetical protein
MSDHYAAGYRTATSADRKDIDSYLARRNRVNPQAFETGWFDALEDMSDHDTRCAQRYLGIRLTDEEDA